jgi:ribonuclease HII
LESIEKFLPHHLRNLEFIAGVDEVGRGPLSGPVVAAAVILPKGFCDSRIKDSKQIKSQKKREEAEQLIYQNAISWFVSACTEEEIDQHNILQATFMAMKRSLSGLKIEPEFIYVDGDKFPGYESIPYECVIKGDSKVISIAAASIIAKTHRDRIMQKMSIKFPQYGWGNNMGYGTPEHLKAIKEYGITKYHRKTFCTKFI